MVVGGKVMEGKFGDFWEVRRGVRIGKNVSSIKRSMEKDEDVRNLCLEVMDC